MPKLGMEYSDCAKRIKRIQVNPGHPRGKVNIINSLKNQCRLAEGESSLKELERECALSKSGSSFTGAGNKQIGICMKFNCINRNDKCDECIKGSAYSIRNAGKTISAYSKNAELGGLNA